MKPKSNAVFAVSVAFAITLILFQSGAAAQQSRPRYSSPSSGERSWTLPADTVISVQMNGTLSSRTSRVGDRFAATVTIPVYINGRTVIPAGSTIEGRVTQVTPAKRMSRSGSIGIDFDDLVFPNGARVGLVGGLTSDDPETRRRIDDESNVSGESNRRTAVFVGGGGAIGAVLGGIAGGGKGAAIGGIAGAGMGVAGILLSKGEEAQVPSGTPFGVQLKQSLVIRESFTMDSAPDADRSVDQPGDNNDSSTAPDRRPNDYDQPASTRTERNRRPNVPGQPTSARPEPEPVTDADTTGPSEPPLPLSSPEMVRRAQGALKEQGYYEGEADGVMSPRTSNALRAYQREHNLQETGDLDPQTAKSLGIIGAPARVSERSPERPRETSRDPGEPSGSVMATVLSASASRTPDRAIYVLINTQANTAGWRWVGEHVVNGDTLEVYAKAIRPSGMVAQVLTRGRIELTVRDGVDYVRRVVIHSAGGDQEITLQGRSEVRTAPSSSRGTPTPSASRPDVRTEPSTAGGTAAASASALQLRAEDLLSEYQRLYGIRVTGIGIEIDNTSQYRQPEIELLFAIDGFANATQLYARLTSSLHDREGQRGAVLAMARQARRTDRVISTTTSRGADTLATRWDSIRQDVLRIMQTYGIATSEIED